MDDMMSWMVDQDEFVKKKKMLVTKMMKEEVVDLDESIAAALSNICSVDLPHSPGPLRDT